MKSLRGRSAEACAPRSQHRRVPHHERLPYGGDEPDVRVATAAAVISVVLDSGPTE
jgi:hypothetical protein